MTTTPPPPDYPPAGVPEPPPSPGARPPGKGLALASLLCGIGGLLTCGLTAVIGVILGIVALVKIGKGAATGKGLAVAGLVVSGAVILLLPLIGVVAALFFPAVTRARGIAQHVAFQNNLKQLCVAAQVYAMENKERLPSPETWPEQLEPFLDGWDGAWRDPSEPDGGRAVAMNGALRRGEPNAPPEEQGMRLPQVHRPAQTVLFFECRPGAPPAGGPELLPDEPRYLGTYVVAFCDGHVEAVEPGRIGDLVWDPLGP
jgi:prepilin-type processing-associated H-X9-DG protein